MARTCGYTYAVESPAASSLRRHGLLSSDTASDQQVALRADCIAEYLAANGREEEAAAMAHLSYESVSLPAGCMSSLVVPAEGRYVDGPYSPQRGVLMPDSPGRFDHRMSPLHRESYEDEYSEETPVHVIPVARTPEPSHSQPLHSRKNGGLEMLSAVELERILTEREIPHLDCRTKAQLLARLKGTDSMGRNSLESNSHNSHRKSPLKANPGGRNQSARRRRPSHSLMPMNQRNNPSRQPPSPQEDLTATPKRTASPRPSRHAFHDPDAEVEILTPSRPPPADPNNHPQPQSPSQNLRQSRTQDIEVEVLTPSRPPRSPSSPDRALGQNRTQELLLGHQISKSGVVDTVSDAPGMGMPNNSTQTAGWEEQHGEAESSDLVLLFSAAREGDVEELNALLGVGGGVQNLLTTRHPELGGSALHEAVEARQHGAVTVLIKAAQYEAKRRGDDAKQAIHDWLSIRNHNGDTALHIGARVGHTGLVMCLLQHGADPDALDLQGRTAAQVAATQELAHAINQCKRPDQGSPQELRLQTGATYFPSTAPGPEGPRSERRRVALVIGNDNYSGNVAKLNNCVNDAKDVAVVLQQLNFMVMVVSDQTRSQMLACIRAFRQGIRDSDIVLLYFSGHGVEHEGVPYLLPIHANAVHSSDYELEAVSLNWILKTLNTVKGSTTNLLFLDSCRVNTLDDTFKGEGAVGLSMKGFRAPSGAEYCIALSSDPGTASHSAPGLRNSVFTEHLLDCLKEQTVCGLDVELMLRHVRERVMSATEQKQRPWTQSCLGVDGFRFNEPKSGAE